MRVRVMQRDVLFSSEEDELFCWPAIVEIFVFKFLSGHSCPVWPDLHLVVDLPSLEALFLSLLVVLNVFYWVFAVYALLICYVHALS